MRSDAMNARPQHAFALRTSEDVVLMRQKVREHATSLGFSLVDQTKLVTAASELARNAVIHAGGGEVSIERMTDGLRRGLRLVFTDRSASTYVFGVTSGGQVSVYTSGSSQTQFLPGAYVVVGNPAGNRLS